MYFTIDVIATVRMEVFPRNEENVKFVVARFGILDVTETSFTLNLYRPPLVITNFGDL